MIMNPDPKVELVSLVDAAKHLGVHYMTAYRYVRTGRMIALKQGGQWWVSLEDLAAVAAEGTGVRGANVRKTEGPLPAKLAEQFTARLIAGDTSGCWDLISDALSSGATAAEVHQSLLQKALESVGDAWHTGQLTVADEHRATATAYRLLGQLGPLFRHPGRRRGTVVIGVCAGDYHAMPSAFLADLLSDRRFEVIDLGGNTPTESFLDTAASVDDLVGIGVCAALDESVPTVWRQAVEIRKALPLTFILVGGSAFARTDSTHFGPIVDAISHTSGEACDAFEAPRRVPAAVC